MSILILYPHRFSQELKRIQKGCGRLSMTSSGRLTLLSLKNTEGFRTFSLKSAREVFGLKWPKQPDTAWHSLTHLKFSYFLVSKSESRGNFLRGGQGRSQEEMAPCQSCHTAGELFAEVGTISRLGNPFVFFFLWTIIITAITSKRLFFLCTVKDWHLQFFHVTGVSASLRPTFWLA